jgi:hypothetical protein
MLGAERRKLQATGGERPPPSGYWTVTVPVMLEWFVQWYEYVPAVLNVRVALPDVMFPTSEGEPPVVNVTLCAVVPASFVHVTVPPLVIVTALGVKENEAEP